MQYTLRGIPKRVDRALRRRARTQGKSLNRTAIEALAEGAGLANEARRRRSLGDVAGTWRAERVVEAALAEQDRVDEDLWR